MKVDYFKEFKAKTHLWDLTIPLLNSNVNSHETKRETIKSEALHMCVYVRQLPSSLLPDKGIWDEERLRVRRPGTFQWGTNNQTKNKIKE